MQEVLENPRSAEQAGVPGRGPSPRPRPSAALLASSFRCGDRQRSRWLLRRPGPLSGWDKESPLLTARPRPPEGGAAARRGRPEAEPPPASPAGCGHPGRSHCGCCCRYCPHSHRRRLQYRCVRHMALSQRPSGPTRGRHSYPGPRPRSLKKPFARLREAPRAGFSLATTARAHLDLQPAALGGPCRGSGSPSRARAGRGGRAPLERTPDERTDSREQHAARKET